MDHNTFWLGYTLKGFLFPNFDIESPSGLISICIGTAMLVIFFESLRTTRAIKKLKSNTVSGRSLFRLAFSRSTETSNLIDRTDNVREVWKISDIFFHFCELVTGYMLMMIAMTYNGYIMISICLGAGIAYLTIGSVLLNVTAQLVVEKLCTGCQMKSDGNSTPVIEIVEENIPSTSGSNEEKAVVLDNSTTVQVHV